MDNARSDSSNLSHTETVRHPDVQTLEYQIEQEQRKLGARLRAARENRRYTLSELSKALTEKDPKGRGLSPAQISRFENGQTSPNLAELHLLRSVLGFSIRQLLGTDPKPWFIVRNDIALRRLQEVVDGVHNIERSDRAHQHFLEDKVYSYVPLSNKPEYLRHGDFMGEMAPRMSKFLFRIGSIRENEIKANLESHRGEEVIYVIKGELQFWFQVDNDPQVRTLSEGDCLQFSSELAHGFRSTGKEDALALFVYLEDHSTDLFKEIPDRKAESDSPQGTQTSTPNKSTERPQSLRGRRK